MRPGLDNKMLVNFKVNGDPVSVAVESRRSLLDCLRDDLLLNGTRVGCEHGVCGCCNVTVNGDLVRSCLMFAYQVDGAEIRTIEGVENSDGSLSPLQEALCARHGMQCGYCTPGMVMMLENLLEATADPSEDQIIDAMSGNLCRCTGYQQILDAVHDLVAANKA
jgi:aerobic carbon-monoxide dehydrogenase small subunit